MVADTRVFSTFFPRTKYSFAFSKIYLPIFPGICALFLCLLLREYIYPGISSFSKYFRKIFFARNFDFDRSWVKYSRKRRK